VLRYHLLPAIFYLLAAIAFSWPLVLNVTDHVVLTGSGDAWAHLWNSWWAKFSLLNLHTSPFQTEALYWPQGASLYFHALDPFTGYLSTPLQLLFGLVPAFNLLVLFEITLAGYSAYQLARYLTSNASAAFVAGLIYAFSPLESLYLNLGQLELMSIGWLPLFILFFIKTVRGELRVRLNFGLSIVFLLIISLVTWYYALYALFFAGLYTLYRLFESRKSWRKDWLKVVGLAGGVLLVYLVLISPVLLPTLKEASAGGTQAQQSLFNVVYNSADLQGFVWPGPSALWSIFGTATSQEYRGVFLGFVSLLLAIGGLVVQPRKGWFWAGLALIFLVLALGPVLLTHFCYDLHPQADGSFVCSDQTPSQSIPNTKLPGQLIFSLPFGSIARVPLRFVLLVMLALAMLAALGLDYLQTQLEKLQPHRVALWQWLPPIIAGSLIFLEFLPLPRVLHDTSYSPFYAQIRDEGAWNTFALLETPDNISAIAEYYQTIHQHPILGGYLSRKETYPYDDTPGWFELRYLNFRSMRSDIIPRDSLANTPLMLAFYHIRYVVLHPQALNDSTAATAQDVITATFGDATPYYQDKDVRVYRAPDNIPNSIKAKQLIVTLAQQAWGGRDYDAAGRLDRSITGPASLLVFNASASPLKVTLHAQIQAKVEGSALTLQQQSGDKRDNPSIIGRVPVTTQSAEVSFNLTLTEGLNTLTFQPSNSDKAVLTFYTITFTDS
jgi:hypothetical protein